MNNNFRILVGAVRHDELLFHVMSKSDKARALKYLIFNQFSYGILLFFCRTCLLYTSRCV